ncbi:hypothetical protein FOA52_003265 [Chlamydomonas sp. UWO 241]|nr:hypothetical protein FOA52_003265 [Chlamydomonas sp. UWO 241]
MKLPAAPGDCDGRTLLPSGDGLWSMRDATALLAAGWEVVAALAWKCGDNGRAWLPPALLSRYLLYTWQITSLTGRPTDPDTARHHAQLMAHASSALAWTAADVAAAAARETQWVSVDTAVVPPANPAASSGTTGTAPGSGRSGGVSRSGGAVAAAAAAAAVVVPPAMAAAAAAPAPVPAPAPRGEAGLAQAQAQRQPRQAPAARQARVWMRCWLVSAWLTQHPTSTAPLLILTGEFDGAALSGGDGRKQRCSVMVEVKTGLQERLVSLLVCAGALSLSESKPDIPTTRPKDCLQLQLTGLRVFGTLAATFQATEYTTMAVLAAAPVVPEV